MFIYYKYVHPESRKSSVIQQVGTILNTYISIILINRYNYTRVSGSSCTRILILSTYIGACVYRYYICMGLCNMFERNLNSYGVPRRNKIYMKIRQY